MKNRKLVLFDFCETLVDFQTADRFVDYVRDSLSLRSIERRYRLYHFLRKSWFFHVMNRLFPKASVGKRCYLYQLRGVEHQNLETLAERYYHECIRPRLVDPLMDRLQEHIRQGDRIWIVSGGYDLYIKHFSDHFDVERVIATELEIEDGRATGFMQGEDCLHENKISRLVEVLYKEEESPPEIIAYSDSRSDLPLLLFADKAIVVSQHESQPWARDFGFEEIIWK